MQGLRPEQLTDGELRHYASLYGVDKLPVEWLKELAKRFVDPMSVPSTHR